MNDNLSPAIGVFVAFILIPQQYAKEMQNIALRLNAKCKVTSKRIAK